MTASSVIDQDKDKDNERRGELMTACRWYSVILLANKDKDKYQDKDKEKRQRKKETKRRHRGEIMAASR